MIVDAALRAVMQPREPGQPKATFILNEFRTMGRMDVLSQVWGAVRGYGIQLVPALQSYGQLVGMYDEQDAKTFVEQAGVLVSFGANHMETADFLSRRCGERTEIVPSYSTNESINNGGMSTSGGLSYAQVKTNILTPFDAFGMKDGELLLFPARMKGFVPAFAPSYWNIRQCRERARANPYYLTAKP